MIDKSADCLSSRSNSSHSRVSGGVVLVCIIMNDVSHVCPPTSTHTYIE